MGELALIEQIRRDFGRARTPVRVGIGDDCAVLRPGRGDEIVVTTDFTLEGRHFRRDLHTAESAGHRCLARGLSDIAAMGARPVAAFLSLALPAEIISSRAGKRWVEGFFRGLKGLANQHGVSLAGGDTSESPDGVLADIVVLGAAPKGTALLRSGASAGDGLYVTGRLGGAAAELDAMMRRKTRRGGPQMFPEPRVKVGEALRRRGLASACMDLSDGLSTDLAHLCRASRVAARVDVEALPIHPLAAKADEAQALWYAIDGGEDYELLFTAPAGKRVPRAIAGVPVTRIGELVPARRGRPRMALVEDGRERELKPGGWEHFRAK